MNADVTPMNAERIRDRDSGARAELSRDSMRRNTSCIHRRSSAFIGVTSAFNGVSKDFRLT
jgi:hypothetical protein